MNSRALFWRLFWLLWLGWTVFWMIQNAAMYVLEGRFNNLVSTLVLFVLASMYLSFSHRASRSAERPPEQAS